MNVTITPAKLQGTVTPPPSKSQAHRALIAAALTHGGNCIDNVARSRDIEATVSCLEQFGAHFAWDGNCVNVLGLEVFILSAMRWLALPRLDCGESGSTLRFLIPVAMATCGGGIFSGRGRLMERPLKPYFDLFDEKGIQYEQKNGKLTVLDPLPPGEYRLRGDVSSQFVTGLLYALPLLDGNSEIILTSPLESRDYVAMTLDVLEKFGIRVENQGYERFLVPGNQMFQARDMTIEADWSQAGFWYAAKLLGSPLEVGGMDPGSVQGDRVILEHYEKLSGPGDVELDVSGCPDLMPPLAAMAAVRSGETRLTNAARLRLKESDRLASVTQVLGALGADITEGADSLTVCGKDCLAGGVKVDSFNDHRIAMMAAIAATRCVKPITITGAECVMKSYPSFWEEYESLGGKIQKSE